MLLNGIGVKADEINVITREAEQVLHESALFAGGGRAAYLDRRIDCFHGGGKLDESTGIHRSGHRRSVRKVVPQLPTPFQLVPDLPVPDIVPLHEVGPTHPLGSQLRCPRSRIDRHNGLGALLLHDLMQGPHIHVTVKFIINGASIGALNAKAGRIAGEVDVIDSILSAGNVNVIPGPDSIPIPVVLVRPGSAGNS